MRLLALTAFLIAFGVIAARFDGGAGTPSGTRGGPAAGSPAVAKDATGTAQSSPSPAQAYASHDPVRGYLGFASRSCRSLPEWVCRGAIEAGLDAMGGELQTPVARAVADSSLLCGDDLDCPRSFLESGTPVGSVVFTFADGARAWVNVMRTETNSRYEDHTQRLVARVIRWFPPDG